MHRRAQPFLITSLLSFTVFSHQGWADFTGCTCPTIYASDGSEDAYCCFANSTGDSQPDCYNTGGCNGGCNCGNIEGCQNSSHCGCCDWLGGLHSANVGTPASSNNSGTINLCTNNNGASTAGTGATPVCHTGQGITIIANGNQYPNLALKFPLFLNMDIQTGGGSDSSQSNSCQLIQTTHNSASNPVYFAGSKTHTIHSGVSFQDSYINIGNGGATDAVEFIIKNLTSDCGNWNGNNFNLNTGNGNQKVTWTMAGGTCPTDYNDTFNIAGGSSITISNTASSSPLYINGLITADSTSVTFYDENNQGIYLYNNANTFPTISVTQGTLGMGGTSVFGEDPSITLGAAAIQMLTSSLTLAGAITLTSATSTLNLGGETSTLSASISGTGTTTLVIDDTVGGGVMSMTSSNGAFSGAFSFEGGTLVIFAPVGNQTTPGNMNFTEGYLGISSPSGANLIANPIMLGSSTGGFDVYGNRATSNNYFNFTENVSDSVSSGNLNIINSQSTPGSILLSGALLYTGTTSISGASTLQLSPPSTSSIMNSSSIAINGSTASLQILGAITLPTISGTGNLVLSTISATDTVSMSGSVDIGNFLVESGFGCSLATNGYSFQASNVAIINNLTLIANTDIITVTGPSTNVSTGVIAGLGGLSIVSGGSITLTGNNTFSGGTTVASGGTVVIGSASVDTTPDNAFGTGPVTSTGGMFVAGVRNLYITGNTWTLASGSTTFSSASGTAYATTLGSVTTSSGSVSMVNDLGNNLIWTSLNIVSGTTLKITTGSGVSIGSFGGDSGTLKVEGTLTVQSTTASTFAGILEDYNTSCTLNVQAPLTLTGNNSFTGGVILGSGGELTINSLGNLGSSTATLTGSGGTLNALSALTVSNPLSLTGGTTTTFSGNLTITGNTSVASGNATIASIGSNVLFRFSTLSISNGATLSTNGNDIFVDNFSSGTGTIVLGATPNSSATSGTTDALVLQGSGSTFSGLIQDAGNGGLGAVYIAANSTLSPYSVTGNTFSGGLFLGITPSGTITSSTLTITNSNAVGNGAIYSYGGGLCLTSNLSIDNDWILYTVSGSTATTTISCSGGSYSVSLGNVSTSGSGPVLFTNDTNNSLTINTITVGSGTTLEINAGSGITVSTIGGAIGTVPLSGELTIASGSSSTLSATITDLTSAGSLNVALTLGASLSLTSSSNSFSGGITLTSGTLQVTTSGAIPSSGTIYGSGGGLSNTSTSIITVSNPFLFTGDTTTTFGGLLTLQGPISVTGSSNTTATLARSSSTSSTQFLLTPSSLTIPTGLSLATNGNNITTNSFSGTGTLVLGASSTTDTLTINSSAGNCSLTIADAGSSAKGAVVVTGSVNLLGTNTFSGGFTLGSITTQGTVTVSSATALGAGTVTTNGGVINLSTPNFSMPGNFLLNALTSNLTTTIGSVLGGASLGSVATQLPFGAASGFAQITNNTSATLTFSSLNVASLTTLAIDTSAGGGITLSGSFGSGIGTLQVDGALNIASTNSTSFAGIIGDLSPGQGSLVVNTATNAALTLSGANTFSGGVLLEAGTLVIGSSSALGSGTVISSGATVSSSISTLTIGNAWVFNATSASPPPTTTFICNNHSCTTFSLGSASISGSSGSVAEIVNNSGITLSFTTLTIDNGVTLDLNAIYGVSVDSLSLSTGALALSGTLTIASTPSTFVGTISDLTGTGIGSLSITGPVTLSGVNTFSGNLLFSNGGNLSVSSPANLSTSSTLTGAGGTLSATSAITVANPWTLNTGSTMTFQGDISLTGAITVSGSSTATIATIAGSTLSLTPSSVTISSGILATNGNNLTIGSGGTFGSGTLALGSGSTTDTLTIGGASLCSWNIVNATTGTGAVIVSANTTLSGKNTFTEGLTVNNSTLSIASSNALGSGTVTSNGGTFLSGIANFNSSNSWVVNTGTTTTFGCTSTSCGSTTLTSVTLGGAAGTATMQNTTTGNLQFNSISIPTGYTASLVTGSAGMTVAGFGASTAGTLEINGILTLSAGGTYSGTISAATGTTSELSSNIANAASLTISSFSVPAGSILNVSTGSNMSVASLAGSGTLGLNGTLTLNPTSSFTFIGTIADFTGTGLGSLSITGPVILSGVNTFSGSLLFSNGGNLSVSSPANLSTSSTLTGAGGTLSATSAITVANPWTLNTGSTMTFQGDISLTGAITVSGSSTATIATIAGSTLSLTPSSVTISSGTLATNGNNLTIGSGGTFGSGTLALGSGSTIDTLTISGASLCSWNIVNATTGTGAVTINATTTLSGRNTFTDGLTVNNSTLNIGSSNALGSGTVTSNGGTFLSGIANFNSSNSWVVNTGTTTTFGCTSTSCGSTTLTSVTLGGAAGTATMQNTTTGNLQFNSISIPTGYTASLVTGSAGMTVAGFGASTAGTLEINGILTLSAGGTYSGTISAATGTTSELSSNIANAASLTISSFSVPAGSILNVSTGSNMSVASLAGTGTLNIGGSLTINAGSSFAFAGAIADATSLSKTGELIINPSVSSATITFSGSNSFSGGVILSGGTLAVSSSSNVGIGIITANGGAITNTAVSPITVSNPWIFSPGYTTTIDGGVVLAGSIAVNSNGTATLANVANLSLELNNVTLDGITYPALSLTNGTTFVTNGHDILLEGSFGSGSGTLLLGTTSVTDTLTISNTAQAVSFSGNINDFNTGAGATGSVIIASGATLTGNNTFTGGLTLGVGNASSNQAVLTINNNNSIGDGTITGNGGTLSTSNSFTISNDWTFDVGTNSATSFAVNNTTTNTGNIQVQTLTINGALTTSNSTDEAYIYNISTGNLTVKSESICGIYNVDNTTSTVNSVGGTLNWNANATCSIGSVETFAASSFRAGSEERLSSPPPSIVNMTVSHGLLAGTGEMTTLTVKSLGAVGPGVKELPIGILTVTETATFEDNATLFIGSNGTDAGHLIVGGTITLDPGAFVSTVPVGAFQGISEHLILTAGTLNGQFSRLVLVPPVSFVEAELIYDVPNQISLRITPQSIEQTSIKGINAQHVAATLDDAILYNRENVTFTINCCPPSVDPSSTLVVPDVLISLKPFIGDSEAMSDALDKLHPALFKGLTIVQESNMVQVQKTVEGRTQYLLDTTSCYNVTQEETSCCEKSTKFWDLWADGLGAILHQDSNWSNGSPQVGYQSKMAGFTIGLDAHFAKHFYLGVMGGYTSSFVTFEKSRGTGNIETGYGGAYFSAISDMFYGNISVVGGSNNLSGHRYISYSGVHEKAKHSSMGKQLLSHADTGVNIDVMGWFKVRPFDSFDYITQTEDSYTEKGAGDWNLHVSKKNAIMLRNELGLELSSCLCFTSQKWVISPKASWVREVRVKGGSYQASFAQADPIVSLPYTVTGYFPSRNLFSPGLSITGSMCKDLFSVELYYNGEFAHGYSNNAFGGQLRIAF